MAKAPHIELAIRISDGTFETKVLVPMDCAESEREAAIGRWLRLAGEAMKLGVSNMSANLERGKAHE